MASRHKTKSQQERDANARKNREINGLIQNLNTLLESITPETEDSFILGRMKEILREDEKALENAKTIVKYSTDALNKCLQQLDGKNLPDSYNYIDNLQKEAKASIRKDNAAVVMGKANSKIAGGSVAIVLGLATMAAAGTGTYYLATEGISQFAQHFAALSSQISTAMTNMNWIAPAAIALVAVIGIAVFALGVQTAHRGNISKQVAQKIRDGVFAKEVEKPRERFDSDASTASTQSEP